jgi:hypothetical protein
MLCFLLSRIVSFISESGHVTNLDSDCPTAISSDPDSDLAGGLIVI